MPERAYETLDVTLEARVLCLSLNRPQVLNALSPLLLEELQRALSVEAADPEARAVLLTGTGRGFCSGADLAETELQGGAEGVVERLYNPVVQALLGLEKPVIAAVNGIAAGAGMSLALACDLRLLSENAVFTLGFSRLGLVMDASCSYFLPRLVGPARTLELAYSGRKVGAEEALSLGLGEQLLPSEDFTEAALDYAKMLAVGPTRSFALTKKQVWASAHNDLTAQLSLEARLQGEASRTDDFAEGVRAFAEKRPPVFEGR